MSSRPNLPAGITACLFDMDGVLTRTAELHAAAWAEMFDAFLKGRRQPPFDPHADYDAFVDGRPRYEGVRAFLASRSIALPDGELDDPPEAETVHGLGNRKNEIVQRLIHERGVRAYEGSVRFLAVVRAAGLPVAVVTSSENAADILEAAQLSGFDARVDGHVAHELGLAGKPAPDFFLEAARRLRVAPGQAAVFEDALAGVEAGRAGGFGLVVGVDRADQAQALREHGAGVVVEDLEELIAR